METTILGPLIIMGDLNADLLKPNEYPGNALMKSLALAKTAVTDISPTRITEISSTCLDIIATSTDLNCTSYSVGTLAASDHFPVEATIDIAKNAILRPIIKRSFNKIDMTDVMNRASRISLDAQTDQSPDQLLAHWQTSINDILGDVAPLKPHPMRKNRVPWMT